MRQAELEPVIADTEVKVEINGNKVNIPGKDAILATNTCELETDDKTTKFRLDYDETVLNATVKAEEFEACELGA